MIGLVRACTDFPVKCRREIRVYSHSTFRGRRKEEQKGNNESDLVKWISA